MRFVAMPHYYFNICNGDGFTPDEEGCDLPDAEAARRRAVEGARSIMSSEVRDGRLDLSSFIEVEIGEAERRLLFTLTFADALDMTPKHRPT